MFNNLHSCNLLFSSFVDLWWYHLPAYADTDHWDIHWLLAWNLPLPEKNIWMSQSNLGPQNTAVFLPSNFLTSYTLVPWWWVVKLLHNWSRHYYFSFPVLSVGQVLCKGALGIQKHHKIFLAKALSTPSPPPTFQKKKVFIEKGYVFHPSFKDETCQKLSLFQ